MIGFPERSCSNKKLERNRDPPEGISPYLRDKAAGCGLPRSSLCREPMAHKVRIFDRHLHLPKSKPIRIGLGILLIAGGLLGFLPVLSVDLPVVRRWRRQLTVWWHRKKDETGEGPAAKPEA